MSVESVGGELVREAYLHSDVDGVHDQVGALWGPGGQNTTTWTTRDSQPQHSSWNTFFFPSHPPTLHLHQYSLFLPQCCTQAHNCGKKNRAWTWGSSHPLKDNARELHTHTMKCTTEQLHIPTALASSFTFTLSALSIPEQQNTSGSNTNLSETTIPHVKQTLGLVARPSLVSRPLPAQYFVTC